MLLTIPNGAQGSNGKQAWNNCRADAETNSTSDDVRFISALIDTAISQHGADPDRVYAFGQSNGGGMAYRLGIELPQKLAAIGVQSALMPARSRPIPYRYLLRMERTTKLRHIRAVRSATGRCEDVAQASA